MRAGRLTRLAQVRILVGGATAVVVFSVLTPILAANRGDISVATSLSLFLLAVVVVTAVGGALPGYTVALIAPFLANWYLIPPYHTLRINDADNVVELFVFVSTAAIVSVFVQRAEIRSIEAGRAEREARTLALLTESTNLDPTEDILDLLRVSLGLTSASLVDPDRGLVTSIGDSSIGDSSTGTSGSITEFPVTNGVVLRLRGPELSPSDERIVRSFVRQLSRTIEQQRLREIALEAESLGRADELRTALLRSVSHDLRTPLANLKASVSSLRQPDVHWSEIELSEFLESIETETDRLTSIIDDLLDLSRIEAGVMKPRTATVPIADVVEGAVHHVDRDRRALVRIDDPDRLLVTDPALLERALANLVDNALKWSTEPGSIVVETRFHQTLDISVVDHGPGIPESDRSTVVKPFHRRGDERRAGGIGLGLAIADRLVTLLGGSLELCDTPGGGLTATIVLPLDGASP